MRERREKNKRERKNYRKICYIKNLFGSKNAAEAFTRFVYMIHIILSSVYIKRTMIQIDSKRASNVVMNNT